VLRHWLSRRGRGYWRRVPLDWRELVHVENSDRLRQSFRWVERHSVRTSLNPGRDVLLPTLRTVGRLSASTVVVLGNRTITLSSVATEAEISPLEPALFTGIRR